MAQILVIASGKGGVGKSTLTAGLSCALVGMGKRVLAADFDIGLRGLDLMLGAGDRVVFDWGDVLTGRCALAQALLETRGPALLASPARWNDAFTPEAVCALIRAAQADYDYVLIDAPAGIGNGFSLAASAANAGIVVATPDEVCVRGAAAAGRRLAEDHGIESRLVINRLRRKAVLKDKLLNIDDVMDAAGLPLLGVVEDDPELSYRVAAGEELPKNTPAIAAFRRIAARLNGESVPLGI